MTSWTRTNQGNISLTVYDEGSVLRLPNLTQASVQNFYQVELQAFAGGYLELPLLSAIPTGAIDAFAQGENSTVRLPGFSGRLANTSSGSAYIEARGGGLVQIPNVTSLDRIDLILRDSGEVTAAQITTFTDAELTVSDKILSLPGLQNFNGSSITAEDGAHLTLAGITQITRTNAGNVSIWASDTNTLVSLPNLTNATVQNFYQFELLAYR